MHQSSSDSEENTKLKELSSYSQLSVPSRPQEFPKRKLHSDECTLSEVEHKCIEQSDSCDKALLLGDGLVVSKLKTSSLVETRSTQEQSVSCQKIDFKCKVIRDHSYHCGCLTPRLHIYLLTAHQCNSSCETKDTLKEMITLQNEDTREKVPESEEQFCKSEILESDVTETELENIVKGESISMTEDKAELRPQQEEKSPNKGSTRFKKKIKSKKSLIKIKESLFKIKKTNAPDQFKVKTMEKSTKISSKFNIRVKDELKLCSQNNNFLIRDDPNKNSKTEITVPNKKKESDKKPIPKYFHSLTKNVYETHVKRDSKNGAVSEKNTSKKVELLPPKKGKKLFQINKDGTFHSFNQNLIRISSVSSLNDLEEDKERSINSKAAEREVNKSLQTKKLEETYDLKYISPLKLNVLLKSSPSDDECPSSLKSLLNSDECSSALNSSTINVEYSPHIKTEPSTIVNLKSETIIEECLNTMIDEENPTDDSLPKLNEFTFEGHLSNKIWVTPSEKYPNFEGQRSCSLCMVPFPNFISLVDHLEKHQRDGLILCYYCQKSFGDKTSMKRHMRTHTGEKPYQCKVCEKRFSLPGNFKKHRDIHENIRTEPCDVCGKTFRRKEHLKYHKRTHTGEKPFKCSLCGSCFTARYSLQIHMNIHLGKKPYKCSYCGKAFSDKSTMRKHIRVHTGERPFKCEVCHKCFGESGTLAAHSATHRQERPYLCPHCHLTFKTNGGLRQHIKTHLGNKQFSCKYCGMMFIQKYNMMMHERIHTGEKPYECSECHRTFRSRSCLGKHIILHGGDAERKYSCDHCNKKFFRKAHLKRHINTHLGIKDHECSFCLKRFCTNSSLKKHLQTFHSEGARAFPCIVCGRIFKRSIYVATHKCISSIIKIESDN